MKKPTKVRIVRTARDGFVLKWKESGVGRQRKCAGSTQRARETERRELETSLNEPGDLPWADFWDRYEIDCLEALGRSKSHRDKSAMMQRKIAAARKGLRCRDVDRALILRVESEMRSTGIEPSTLNSNMATLWAMIGWGQDHGLIPEFRRPRKRSGKTEKQQHGKSRGRSLSGEEIERLIETIPSVVKDYEPAEPFILAVNVMRFTGMRLSEVWDFAWEPVEGCHYPVRLGHESAAIRFCDNQKNGTTVEVPLTNRALEYLRTLPRAATWVCRTSGAKGEHKTTSRLGRVISEAGAKARIVVKRYRSGKIKYASAHDLRRTFATELDLLGLTDRQKIAMTRHSDTRILIDNYLDAPLPVLIEKLRNGG